MAPLAPQSVHWTPTRERAYKLVGNGKVCREVHLRGGDHIFVAEGTMPERRIIAKAVLFLEHIGLVRENPTGRMEVV